MTIAIFVFLIVLLAGVPVFIALAELVADLYALPGGHSRLRHPAPHGGRHRQLPAAGRAVLHPGRQPDEFGRHHQPHLRLRGGAVRLDARRPGARQHHGLGDLRRHVGHRDRRCGRSRHHRDQGHEGSWLFDRVRGRRDGRLGDARADHPAVAAVRDLRHDGQRLDRRAVSGRVHPGRGDDHLHDALRHLLRATLQHGPRPGVQSARARRDVHRRPAAAADAGHHPGRHDLRLVHADRSGDCRVHVGDHSRHLPVSLAEHEAVLQSDDGHHRDDGGRAADRRRGLAVRLGADHHAADGVRGGSAAVLHQQPLRDPAADQYPAAGDWLLPGADRVDLHPGAGADADHHSRSASTRCTSG